MVAVQDFEMELFFFSHMKMCQPHTIVWIQQNRPEEMWFAVVGISQRIVFWFGGILRYSHNMIGYTLKIIELWTSL